MLESGLQLVDRSYYKELITNLAKEKGLPIGLIKSHLDMIIDEAYNRGWVAAKILDSDTQKKINSVLTDKSKKIVLNLRIGEPANAANPQVP